MEIPGDYVSAFLLSAIRNTHEVQGAALERDSHTTCDAHLDGCLRI